MGWLLIAIRFYSFGVFFFSTQHKKKAATTTSVCAEPAHTHTYRNALFLSFSLNARAFIFHRYFFSIFRKFITHLQFVMGWFVLEQSLLTAYLDFRQLVHLCASTFAISTSDLNFDNLDPNINWTMFDSKSMHFPIQRQSKRVHTEESRTQDAD